MSPLPQRLQIYNDLLEIVERATSEDPASQFAATTEFMKLLPLLMKADPPIDENIENSITRRIVEFLGRHDHPQLQLAAATVLEKVVSGTSVHKQVAIQHNAIPLFVLLLKSNCTDVAEQAVRALGDIAADSPQSRNNVLDSGALMPLLDILRDHNSELSMLRVATHSLFMFCHVIRLIPKPYEQLKCAVPVLGNLIFRDDAEVVKAACQALSSLSDGPKDLIQEVINAGVYVRLVVLLKDSPHEILEPLLRTLGNIVSTGYDAEIRLAVVKGLLPRLYKLLAPKQDSSIIEVACWTISKISARTTAQMQLENVRALTEAASRMLEPKRVVIQKGVIPMIMQLLRSNDIDVKEQAVRDLGAIAADSPECRNHVLDSGDLKPLLAIFNEHSELLMLRIATSTLLTFCHGEPTLFEKLKPAVLVLQSLIYKEDAEVVTAACQALSCLSNGPNDLIQAVIEADVYPRLVELLKDSSHEILKPVLQTLGNIFTGYDVKRRLALIEQLLPHLYKLLSPKQNKSIIEAACRTISKITARSTAQMQLRAAWTLEEAASTASEHKKVVIQRGVFPIFVQLLRSDSTNVDVRKQAVWGLVNIAVKTPDCRDYVLNNGALEPLLAQLNEHLELSLLRVATCSLLKFCHGNPTPIEQLRPALPVLRRLADLKDEKVVTAVCEALSLLSNHPDDQNHALKAIQELIKAASGKSEHERVAIQQGAIPTFMQLLRSDSVVIRKQAVRGLGNIAAESSDCRDKVLNSGALKPLLAQLNEFSELSMLRVATCSLLKFCHGSPTPFEQLRPALPVLRRLIDLEDEKVVIAVCKALSLLSNDPDDHNQALKAIQALIKAASGKSEDERVVIQHGAIRTFMQLLRSDGVVIRKRAVRGLGNIAAESLDCRDDLLKSGALEPLLAQLNEHSKLSMLRVAMCSLLNFCRGNPTPFEQLRPALPVLQRLINLEDENVVTAVCEALSLLSNNPNDQSQALKAIQALIKAASGKSKPERVVIQHGAIRTFMQLLRSDSLVIREQAVQGLGNIAAESPDCRDDVLNSGVLKPLLTQLNEHSELSLLRVATRTLLQFCHGSPAPFDQLRPALQVLQRLIDLEDEKVVTAACEALLLVSNNRKDHNQALKAIQALIKAASKKSKHERVVIQRGAIPTFMQLLRSDSVVIRKQAVEGLGNIAAESLDCRDDVLNSGALEPLLAQLNEHSEPSMLRVTTCSLLKFCHGYITPFEQLRPAVPVLRRLIDLKDETVVTAASEGLSLLSNDPNDHNQVLKAIQALIKAASRKSKRGRVLIQHGAILTFMQLLRSNDVVIRKQAVEGLGNIAAKSPDCRDDVLNSGALEPLLAQLNEHSELSMLRVATCTLLKFCHGNPTLFEQMRPALPVLRRLTDLKDEKVVTAVCEALSLISNDPNDQKHALKAIRALIEAASGKSEREQVVIQQGAIPTFMQLLRSDSVVIRKRAIRGLGNIAAKSPDCRDNALNSGALQPILAQLNEHSDLSVLRVATHSLLKFCHGNPTPREQMRPALPNLRRLTNLDDEKVVTAACRALSLLSNKPNDQEQILKAIWALIKAASRKSEHERVVIQQGAILTFMQLLRSDSVVIRKQAAEGLGNIAAESPDCRDNVLNSGALEPLLGQLNEHSELSMLKVATQSLLKFCHGSPTPFEQMRSALPVLRRLIDLEDEKVVTAACEALSLLSNDPNDQQRALKAIRALIKAASGKSKHEQVVIQRGAILTFTQLLRSDSVVIKKRAVRGLGNIAAKSPDCKDVALNSGALEPLLAQLNEHSEPSMLRAATRSLLKFCHGNPIPFEQLRPALPVLRRLTNLEDEKVVTAASKALSLLSKDPNDQNQAYGVWEILLLGLLIVGIMYFIVVL